MKLRLIYSVHWLVFGTEIVENGLNLNTFLKTFCVFSLSAKSDIRFSIILFVELMTQG